MSRFHQWALILATLGVSWLGMQAVHEFGHVLGAWLSGGKIAKVVLHPATISYTRLAENPNPMFVSWMGPIVGVALPLVALAFARLFNFPGRYLVQFFAGFCLIGNGAYLGVGSFDEVGDAGDLLRHGASIALLWLFGVTTIPLGFWLWNGLGPHFGLGAAGGQLNRTVAHVMLSLLVILVTLELVLG
jgi:hypothetical protein